MQTHVLYCSACDREVRVVFPAEGSQNAPETEIDPDGICLDYCGEACTGTMCSLFTLPPREMLVKLKESGLLPDTKD
jgi:hypothetical protein